MFPIAVGKGSPDVPISGVSWRDASAYAAWRTRKTGVVHRLPTDEEWAFAAAEKARDKALPLVDPSDPAQAWIARYENEFSRDRPQNSAPQPGGAFGTNSKGLDDFAGTVWEWTDTCFVRSSLDNGRERVINTNCGVRVVEGATVPTLPTLSATGNRGGCAAGVPPTNLGFRLVVEPSQSVFAGVVRHVSKLLRQSGSPKDERIAPEQRRFFSKPLDGPAAEGEIQEIRAWRPAANEIAHWSQGRYRLFGFDPADGIPSLDLAQSYGQDRLPRYTSYPTAPRFSSRSANPTTGRGSDPFRPGKRPRSVCRYRSAGRCAGTAAATPRSRRRTIPSPSTPPASEAHLVAEIIGRRVPISHIHFGGGTPTIMTSETPISTTRCATPTSCCRTPKSPSRSTRAP